MRHRKAEVAGGAGLLRRSADAVRRMLSRGGGDAATPEADAPAPRRSTPATASPARTTRREADIPLDVLDRAYTPPATSSKASFRSDGADHQLDQEFATGSHDSRWNDEDRYTNKSGDPRIGTHGRTYEPVASREEKRD